MTWLLDTNACIRVLNGTCAALTSQLRRVSPSDIRLCAVVKAELIFGARHSARPAENLRLLQNFFAPFASLPFDDASADCYGSIRHELQRIGTPIGPNDLMIAAIAVSNRLTLVTHNVAEFSRVVGLALEDWEK